MTAKKPSDLDSILSFMPINTQQWILPSGKSVKEIYTVKISQCAEILKKNKILGPVERATLRYDMSRVIDLSAHMQAWFFNIDIQYMIGDHAAVLIVLELNE